MVTILINKASIVPLHMGLNFTKTAIKQEMYCNKCKKITKAITYQDLNGNKVEKCANCPGEEQC